MIRYHVALRDLDTHQDLFDWPDLFGVPMDYPAARNLLITAEQQLAAQLHAPGCRSYLVAEPFLVPPACAP